jgi:hypothetical protein
VEALRELARGQAETEARLEELLRERPDGR